MNYQRIYDQIIERAKTRQLEGYKEKHHIIPKCLGGNNNKNNLVELTAREHFLCHMLLVEIYPNNKKLWYALFLMSINKNKKYVKYKVSSRNYERIKKEWNKYAKGRKKPKGFGKKIISNERNEKIGKSNSKPKPPGFGEKMRNILKGKKRNQSFKENHIKRLSKPILQFDKQGNFIKEWESATIAGQHLNINKSSISAAARGENQTKPTYKSAGGFIWKLKKDI